MKPKDFEARYTIEYGCGRGYWIKCFLTEDECYEEMSSPNQELYEWVEKAAYDDLKAKLDIAREALVFYADHANWAIEDIGGMTHPQEWKKIDGDNGFTAIQALAKIGAGE